MPKISIYIYIASNLYNLIAYNLFRIFLASSDTLFDYDKATSHSLAIQIPCRRTFFGVVNR